jgi:ribosomal protein S18 acetylase RimI-like enzyme
MDIVPLTTTHLPAAAFLFTAALRHQRALTPALPALLEGDGLVIQKLSWLLGAGPAFAAMDAGELIGFLGTILVPRFRNTARKGAYIPEWGHGAASGHAASVYPALYRAAAAQWAEAGCQVHAISILAQDRAAVDQWFWQGFGLTVVDAVRPVEPLPGLPPAPLTIRKATPADATFLAELDDEHCRHYTAAPIFMAPPHQNDEAEFASFLARPHNAAWLALDGDTPAGFLRFDGYEVDGVGILEGEHTVFINGAWLRPAYRGQRLTPAMLDAALRDYAGQGFTCCAVNFESFNPEAALFWPRYFDPVCFSLTRIPETA